MYEMNAFFLTKKDELYKMFSPLSTYSTGYARYWVTAQIHMSKTDRIQKVKKSHCEFSQNSVL